MFHRIAGGEFDPEFRAMWIATVYNIDWPISSGDYSSAQQQQMIEYLDLAQDLKLFIENLPFAGIGR